MTGVLDSASIKSNLHKRRIGNRYIYFHSSWPIGPALQSEFNCILFVFMWYERQTENVLNMTCQTIFLRISVNFTHSAYNDHFVNFISSSTETRWKLGPRKKIITFTFIFQHGSSEWSGTCRSHNINCIRWWYGLVCFLVCNASHSTELVGNFCAGMHGWRHF